MAAVYNNRSGVLINNSSRWRGTFSGRPLPILLQSRICSWCAAGCTGYVMSCWKLRYFDVTVLHL